MHKNAFSPDHLLPCGVANPICWPPMYGTIPYSQQAGPCKEWHHLGMNTAQHHTVHPLRSKHREGQPENDPFERTTPASASTEQRPLRPGHIATFRLNNSGQCKSTERSAHQTWLFASGFGLQRSVSQGMVQPARPEPYLLVVQE